MYLKFLHRSLESWWPAACKNSGKHPELKTLRLGVQFRLLRMRMRMPVQMYDKSGRLVGGPITKIPTRDRSP